MLHSRGVLLLVCMSCYVKTDHCTTRQRAPLWVSTKTESGIRDRIPHHETSLQASKEVVPVVDQIVWHPNGPRKTLNRFTWDRVVSLDQISHNTTPQLVRGKSRFNLSLH